MTKEKYRIVLIILALATVASFFVSRSIYHRPHVIEELSEENRILKEEIRMYRDSIRALAHSAEEYADLALFYEEKYNEALDQAKIVEQEYTAIIDSISQIPDDEIVDHFIHLTEGLKEGPTASIPVENIRTGAVKIERKEMYLSALNHTRRAVQYQDTVITQLRAINASKALSINHHEGIIENQSDVIRNLREQNAILERRAQRWRRISAAGTALGIIGGFLLSN